MSERKALVVPSTSDSVGAASPVPCSHRALCLGLGVLGLVHCTLARVPFLAWGRAGDQSGPGNPISLLLLNEQGGPGGFSDGLQP
jgi:hypothetical protein